MYKQIYKDKFRNWNMRINTDKIKIMETRSKRANISLNGKILQVSKYKHLGVVIKRSGNEEKEIEAENKLCIKL